MSLQPEVMVNRPEVNTATVPTAGTASKNRSIYVSGKTAVLVAPAVTVIATMLVGSVVLTVAGAPLYALEMMLSGLINLSGGVAAAMIVLMLMHKGVSGVAQAGILGIALRCGTVLMGLLLAQALPLVMDRTVLIFWALGFYFPMLIVESTLIAWLSNNLPE